MAKSSGKRAREWFRKPAGTGTARLSRRGTLAPRTRLLIAAGSDVGRVRGNNEDTFRYDEAGLYVVCDGMGGMAAGEIASQIAAETVLREYFGGGERTKHAASVQTRLKEAIAAANGEVLQAAREPGRKGMGTTLVAAALDGEELLVANVGDSRAYLLHQGVLRQVTRDHSFLNEVQRITGLQAEDIPAADMQRFGSLVTRAIGAAADVAPDFFPVAFGAGDLLLLATDGLTRYLGEPEDLLPLLRPEDLEGSCRALIAAALEAGGVDNVTVMLIARDASLPY